MALFGIRNKLKSIVKQTLQLEPEKSMVSNIVPEPSVQNPVTPSYDEVQEPPQQEAAPIENATPAVSEEPNEEAPEPIAEEISAAVSTEEGRPLTHEEVQEVLDEDVRPALQMDGGDIQLVKIEDNNIYVRLVGACSTCPSSVMTMRMGVENLLREEFPALNELIEVQDEMAS